MITPRPLVTALLAVVCAALLTLPAGSGTSFGAAEQIGADPSPAPVVADELFRGGLRGGWQDWGWARREIEAGKPAKIDMSRYGGWLLGKAAGGGNFAALRFRMHAPASFGDFLEVRLRDRRSGGGNAPAVVVRAKHRRPLAAGWVEVTLPARELNPDGASYDHVSFRARQAVSSSWISFDDVVLLAAREGEGAGSVAPAGAGPRSSTAPVKSATLRIDCRAPGHRIDPRIYGIAYSPRTAARDDFVWDLRPGAQRWGGNPASRFNWKLGNAWNTASDWYFQNRNLTGDGAFHWRNVLAGNRRRQVPTALTLPLIGWVAKDTTSYAFPVSVFGPQAAFAPERPDAGNGKRRDGTPLAAGSPTRTSVPMGPEEIGRWVEQIRALDRSEGGRHVAMYMLDNEPMLWNSTHRDVHPEPMGYDELLERTIAYGTAVRRADPEAIIAGPAVWGWPAYFYSARDAAAGFHRKPDRLAHGDEPLLAWYLRKLREHEQKTGVRILDVLDVHFYPQARGVFVTGGGATDPATAALRLRSTRALWDSSYVDESWIRDTVQLLPRLQKLIDDNYPGRGICIGEYNFGAERHISGALALAEVLGRFGAFPNLSAAFYWTYPPEGSFAFQAFRAFRNFDGRGARFLDRSVPAASAGVASLFASRDEAGTRLVAVALNTSPEETLAASIALEGCAAERVSRVFVLSADRPALEEREDHGLRPAAGALAVVLPPHSLTVLELTGGSRVPARD